MENPPKSIKILGFLNVLLKYISIPLESIAVTSLSSLRNKGFKGIPCSSLHNLSAWSFSVQKGEGIHPLLTWTFPSHQQVVLTAQERNPKLRHCRTTKQEQPFSWEGPQLASYALEKNPMPKFSFSEVSHNKSWSTTSTIYSWAMYSVRLSSSQV